MTALDTKLGWRISDAHLPLGSMGFASLSLGRDRYFNYAAQRLSRATVNHLLAGHMNPTSNLPSNDQLRMLMDNQWELSLRAIGLPMPGASVVEWFKAVAFPQLQLEARVREAIAPVGVVMSNTTSAQAAAWLRAVQGSFGALRSGVSASLRSSAYAWAESWAERLERATKAELLRVASTFGLPYGRELLTRVRARCDEIISQMSNAKGNHFLNQPRTAQRPPKDQPEKPGP